MTTVQGGTILVRVEGRDIGLSELLSRINSQMNSSVGVSRNYATAMAQIDPVLRRTDQELAKYAQSLAQVAAKSGDVQGSQKILASALGQITPNTTAANNVLAQLQDSINKSAAAAQKQSINFQNLAAGIQTVVGGYLIATRVIGQFAEVIGAGNQLEKTLISFRVLSGTQAQYEQNLAAARQQQERFGGSLQDTVEGMSAFANLSKRTGINIAELTNLARAMAIIDPAQGFKGAGIALKEFFSGDITSLARRFEIPRDALNGIKNIADETERFAALQKVLANYGITTDLLGEQAKSTAVQYEKLAGNAEDATAAIGQGLARAFSGVAELASNTLRSVADGITALVTQAQQLNSIKVKVFDSTQAAGLDAFNQKVREINTQLPFYADKLRELTPAQYSYANSLIQTGVASDVAINKATELSDAINTVTIKTGDHFTKTSVAAKVGADAFVGYEEAALRAASADETGAIFAQQVAIAVVTRGLSTQDAITALTQYADAAALAGEQDSKHTASIKDVNAAMNEEAIEALNTANASDQLKARQEALMAILQALANGTIGQAQAESILANQYGITAAQLPGLIQLTYDLAAARQAEIAASNALNQASANQKIANDRAAGRIGRGDNISEIAGITAAAQRQADALAKAEEDHINKTGTAAQKRQLLNDKLKDAIKLYGANSAAALNAGTALDAFEIAQDKAAKKGGGGAPKLSANEKLNTQLLDQQDKFNAKFEDAELKHFDKLADIQEDFNKRQSEQFRKNEVDKRRSRADFYSGLQDVQGINVDQFAASYEEAFAQAQALAQQGKAKLSAEFLSLRQDQISEMLDLEKEAADIRKRASEGDIDEETANKQLAFLEGRKALIKDAQDEELKQLIEGGDENQNRLQEQLDAENAAYEQQTGKIVTQAERAAQAKITHAERSKIAVDEENRSLAEQENIYARIASKNGGILPRSNINANVPTQAAPADVTSDKPVDIAATSPIPVSTTDALLVRQVELFVVRDQDVINSLGDVGTRLENRLIEVATSVNTARDTIANAVKAVENAIGRVRPNQQSVVGA